MRVLILNGSPRPHGNTAAAIDEMVRVFDSLGVETEIVQVGGMTIRGCVACNACKRIGRCAMDDIVNEVAREAAAADGIVAASPVYYATANSTLTALMDRLFYSIPDDLTMKVGASVAVARRSGCTTTFNQLNLYFTNAGMPLAASKYWNNIHGNDPGEYAQDPEGLWVMRTLARNMTFLMKSIALGRETFGLPEKETPRPWTNFVR